MPTFVNVFALSKGTCNYLKNIILLFNISWNSQTSLNPECFCKDSLFNCLFKVLKVTDSCGQVRKKTKHQYLAGKILWLLALKQKQHYDEGMVFPKSSVCHIFFLRNLPALGTLWVVNVCNLYNMALSKFFSLIISSFLDKMGIELPTQYVRRNHPKQCLILNSFPLPLNTATSGWNDHPTFERTPATVCPIPSLPHSPSSIANIKHTTCT